MGRPKAAPFYLFLLDFKDSYRRTRGVNLSRDKIHDLASSEWSKMDPMTKRKWKELAEKKNAEIRQAPPINQPPVSPVPFDLRSRYGQLTFKADAYMKLLTRERVSLMAQEFVTCSIVPFFKNRDDACGPETYYPGEICLVKWSISQGVKSLYHVYLNPASLGQFKHVSPREWTNWSSAVTCRDLDMVGEELASFVGNSVAVLVRSSQIEKTEACLKCFETIKCRVVSALDQSIIFYNLMMRETDKKLTLKDVRAKFPARTGMSGIRMEADGSHTGVRCVWHKNDAFCSARRALEDSFVMASQLGTLYMANCAPGTHYPKTTQLVDESSHNCLHKINYSQLIQDAKKGWQAKHDKRNKATLATPKWKTV